MMMHLKKGFWSCLFATFFLIACQENQTGSSTSKNEVAQPEQLAKLVASIEELPRCNEETVGSLFYVIESETFQNCFSTGYKAISFPAAQGPDGVDGKPGTIGEQGSSCSLTEIEGVGFELSCEDGNTVILKNGEDGEDTSGEDPLPAGENGTPCDYVSVEQRLNAIECEDGTRVEIKDGTPGERGDMGERGDSGVGIEWLGALTTAPEEPTLNKAFYWEGKGVSCIWDGDSWEKISSDEGVTEECPE